MDLHNSPAELEVRRIARLANLEPGDLTGLESIGVQDLRTLRDQIAAKLFDEHTESWQRAVAVSAVVPAALSAKLSEAALGPVLCARVTPLTPPAKAVDIGSRMSPEFMAEVAINLDPRKVSDLVVAMPPATIAAISRVLADRSEWLVMADFVATVHPEALRATIQALDEESILRIAVLLEDRQRIIAVAKMMGQDRLAGMRQAAADNDLQAHLDFVRDSLDSQQRARLAGD